MENPGLVAWIGTARTHFHQQKPGNTHSKTEKDVESKEVFQSVTENQQILTLVGLVYVLVLCAFCSQNALL